MLTLPRRLCRSKSDMVDIDSRYFSVTQIFYNSQPTNDGLRKTANGMTWEDRCYAFSLLLGSKRFTNYGFSSFSYSCGQFLVITY